MVYRSLWFLLAVLLVAGCSRGTEEKPATVKTPVAAWKTQKEKVFDSLEVTDKNIFDDIISNIFDNIISNEYGDLIKNKYEDIISKLEDTFLKNTKL